MEGKKKFVIVELLNIKDKEQILKAAKEKWYTQGNNNSIQSWFPVRNHWSQKSKMSLKYRKKKLSPQNSTQWKYPTKSGLNK